MSGDLPVLSLPFSSPCPQEAWGWEAWRRWCDMAPAAREAGGYSYLESFKLLLRERGAAGRDGGYDDGEEQQLDTVCPLPAGLTAVQVAADFLGAMRRWALCAANLLSCGNSSSLHTWYLR